MSIELSRDASRLIEDIELELASIRAAMALRPLEPSLPRALTATDVEPAVPAVRRIGPFDLSRAGAKAAPEAATVPEPAASEPAAELDGAPKRMTLQERLASLQDKD